MSETKGDAREVRRAAFAAADDTPANPCIENSLGDLINRRLGRRDLLKGMLVVGAVASMGLPDRPALGLRSTAADQTRFDFSEIEHGVDGTHHVAPGYDAEILLRWGDPLFSDAPAFDPDHPSAAAQALQFGYNNDFLGLLPLGSAGDRGLLCVNHEYTNEELMFPGLERQDRNDFIAMTAELVATEMAAHGGTVVEIARIDGRWRYLRKSPYNRRITALTPMRIAGPAAGHARMRTGADPTGTRVLGTLNNCAGGITPWGTYLMAEENFNGYFWGKEAIEAHPEANVFERYGIPGAWYNWGQYHDRFDIAKEPNEANRFGWIVEVDPRDPASTPIKRTALGRFKHEGAEPVVNHDGRVVIYSGDDQRFDYLYKFVSVGVFDPDAPDTNHDLLDQGTLYVAKFDADGTLSWLPLVHGEGPLIAENGFPSQADVLISTRLAADLLGATPMDRPEDVGVNHSTGKAYVMLTSNDRRTAEQTDAIHTRAENHWGLVLEITPMHGDHASNRGHWAVLVSCGDPAEKTIEARWNPATSENGWFSNPDNCAVDPDGGLWVATDQGSLWQQNSGSADGLWTLETEGEARGTGRMFFRVPVGAELCGPCFTDDGQTLFLAVQHPAADGSKHYPGFGRASSFQDPATRWPDFREGVPPRPSIVVVTRRDGGRIGG